MYSKRYTVEDALQCSRCRWRKGLFVIIAGYTTVRGQVECRILHGADITVTSSAGKNAPSYILNVASMAGLAPIPVKNMYSATKAAIIFFSYSLRYQLMDKGISVSCLAPGPVFTKPAVISDTKQNWAGLE